MHSINLGYTSDDEKRYQDFCRKRNLPMLYAESDWEIKQGEAKNGYIWKIIDISPNENGGKLYRYVLDPYCSTLRTYTREKEGYLGHPQILSDLHDENYPAIEAEWESLAFLIDDFTKEELEYYLKNLFRSYTSEPIKKTITNFELNRKSIGDLNRLGYSCQIEKNLGDVFLTLPDIDALRANIQKLSDSHPNLKLFELVNSAGAATDEEYVGYLLRGEVPLSDGKEFVHDHTIHILPLLGTLLVEEKEPTPAWHHLAELKSPAQRYVQDVFDKINHAKTHQIQQGISEIVAEKKYRPVLNILAQDVDIAFPLGLISFRLQKFSPTIRSDYRRRVLEKACGEKLTDNRLEKLWKEITEIWDTTHSKDSIKL